MLAQLAAQGISLSEKPAVRKRLTQLTSAVARIGLKTVLRAGDDDLDKLAEPFVAEVDKLDFAKGGAAAEALSLASEVELARASFAEAVRGLLVEPNKRLPLLIVVDELDRARPDFAIEFLEALKFVFSTEHVVFCVSVDRKNLVASLRARFGNSYDVDQYLARLFSFWVRLDNPHHNPSFLTAALKRRSLIEDGLLDESERTDECITSLVDCALVGLGERADNLRSMERCAERANICARSIAPNRWAGLIGFLAGLSVADRDFLLDCVSETHDLKNRNLGPYNTVLDPEPDFLDRLRRATSGAADWICVAAIAWSLPPGDVEARKYEISQVFDERIADGAAAMARELSIRKRLFNRSAAVLVFAEIGWALG